MYTLKRLFARFKFHLLFVRFRDFTMVKRRVYVKNLLLIWRYRNIPGNVVECGTWRGGMIAGIASFLGNKRQYYLYDSFEGLPDAKPIDGEYALKWQKDTTSDIYYDNCTAEESFAIKAMEISGAEKVNINKGWFSDTLSKYDGGDIAVLRLDGDWYDSTMECLIELFPKVVVGGVIVIDDYCTYSGCSRAVHDYLSKNSREERIRQYSQEVTFIKKEKS